jgi:hypothetical protein
VGGKGGGVLVAAGTDNDAATRKPMMLDRSVGIDAARLAFSVGCQISVV